MSNEKEIFTAPKIILKSLTPTKNAENGNLYSEVINNAIEMDGVYNIALTGGYGSGKSSIVETFIKKNELKYRFLRVSLASFNFERSDEEEKSSKISKIFGKTNSESDEKIALEISILQQLLYQLDSKKDGYSIRGRADIKPRDTLFSVVLIFISVFSGQVLWNPYLLNKWLSLSFIESLVSPIWITVFSLLFSTALSIMLYKLIYLLKKAKVSKIDVKPLSLELEKRSEISTFNAFLDELLYAFKKIDIGKKKSAKVGVIVVFEDIDRIKGHEIFQKIRELNNILRYNPETASKKVKFIYAVKESIFVEERDKNKFFDVIIPVLRYVNNQNSKGKLIDQFDEIVRNASWEFNEVLQIASYCIDEMRTINNICNEFQIYQSALLETDKLPHKVLALVIYKNLFPNDFELIHSGESALQGLFDMRDEFVTKKKYRLQQEILTIEKRLADLESDHVLTKIDLRKEYVLAVCLNLKVGESVQLSGRKVSIAALLEDENFERLMNSDLRVGTDFNYRTLSFKEIENNVNINKFARRLELMEARNSGELDSLRLQIQNKEIEMRSINRLPFGELNPEINAASFNLNVEESSYDRFKLNFIQICVNKGHIGLDYKHYISVFHSSQDFSLKDKLFLMSIKANMDDNWATVVEEPSNVIQELTLPEWNSRALVNRNILLTLYEKNQYEEKEGRKQLLKLIINREDKLDIVNELFNGISSKKMFLTELMTEWQAFITSAHASSNGVLQFVPEILLNVSPDIVKNQNTDDLFATFLSNQKTFLNKFPSRVSKEQLRNFKRNLGYLWVKFDRLEISNDTNLKLLDAIFDADVYQLNLHMITLYLKHHRVENYSFSYTGLKAVIPDSPILERIEIAKEDFILLAMKEAVELEMEWSEDHTTSLEIINDTQVSSAALSFLFGNAQVDPFNVSELNRPDIFEELMRAKMIYPSWENIVELNNTLTEEDGEIGLLLNDSDWVSKVNEPTNWEEISEEVIYNLIESDINVENLSKLLKNYPNYIDLEELGKTASDAVVGMLVFDKHIQFNRDDFDLLKERFEKDIYLSFIIQNEVEFIQGQEDYSDLEVDEVTYLLENSEKEQLNKTLLGLISVAELETCNSEDAKVFASAYSKYQIFDDLNLIRTVMSKLEWGNQIKWFESIVGFNVFNHAELMELIQAFKEPYDAFANPSVGKWVPFNSEAKLLNELLKDLGLVNNLSNMKNGKIFIKRNSKK